MRWYNDSIATTPESAIAALDAFDGPVVIIAGGYDKGVSFERLGERIAQKAKTAVLIGRTAGKIAEAIENCAGSDVKVEIAESLAGAVAAEERERVQRQ